MTPTRINLKKTLTTNFKAAVGGWSRNPTLKVLFLGLLLIASRPSTAVATDAAGQEFFEKKVRPVLVEQCYKCHSKESEKLKGGLYVDSFEGLQKGGDTGPAVVPGNLEKSLLIKAIRYQDEELQMPPKGKKLSGAQIADLEEWVRMGAPDPRTNQVASASTNSSANHWAFQPIKSYAPPKVKNTKWVQNPVDSFVLAKLEEHKMKPTAPADRRTLIRRAYFDLIGLPPTIEEVDAFVKDKSKDAFEKVVDHLLALPEYGERWGRHWLDVARYADTKGYVFEEERKYGYSYTYRDYVIRSFNEDLPYDQFIKEQVAADILVKGDDKRSLAAMGFLTLGRRFLNNPPDIIDDRIDVVSRGLMGLTVACARCHDHKYDPIPTKDYYSMYGVFASANEPADKPLLGTNSFPKEYPEYVKERGDKEKEIHDYVEDKQKETLRAARNRTGDYLLTSFEGNLPDQKSKKEKIARERKLDPEVANRWSRSLETWLKQTNEFAKFWNEATALDTNNFEKGYNELAQKYSGLTSAFAKPATNQIDSLKQVAELLNKTFAQIETRGSDSSTNKVALNDKEKSLFELMHEKDGPYDFPKDHFNALYDVPTAQKIRALNRKLAELDAQHPGSPPKAMVLVENGTPTNPHVFVRGNPGNQGPEITRHFLQVIAGKDPKPFQHGSGRLEMAEAIASKDNPLTARVYVNRVWLLHFGSGIVSTPSDFGVRSDPPSHPELLDYLASNFMENGWSTKKLHKLMMLSSTYQQSSESNPAYEAVDQSNRYLWKMNRQRLDLEALRDTLLAVSGKLDKTMGGHPVEITTETYSPRRTVYGFIDRQNLPGFFRTFDFASPDTSSSKRFYTTVPQQALFLLNSPFVVDQAKKLASQLDTNAVEKEVTALYEKVLQRKPHKEELAASKSFLTAPLADDVSENSPWSFGYGELNLQEGKLLHFQPLAVFKDKSWQGGDKMPDDKLGWVQIGAAGGHPGNDLQHAGVRRWVAPVSGTYEISGKITHPSDQGDGVRATIISSKGVVKTWDVKHDTKETTVESIIVQKGEVLDFVVDPKESVAFDSYMWSPSLALKGAKEGTAKTVWNSESDFSGPVKKKVPLTRIEELAQVLLLTNELSFVD